MQDIHAVQLHLYEILEHARTHNKPSYGKQVSWGQRWSAGTAKRNEGKNVLYLASGSGYMSIYSSQNSNRALKWVHVIAWKQYLNKADWIKNKQNHNIGTTTHPWEWLKVKGLAKPRGDWNSPPYWCVNRHEHLENSYALSTEAKHMPNLPPRNSTLGFS